jgi:hypothetical protein
MTPTLNVGSVTQIFVPTPAYGWEVKKYRQRNSIRAKPPSLCGDSLARFRYNSIHGETKKLQQIL